MASDDSDHEEETEECHLSAEDAASDGDKSYDNEGTAEECESDDSKDEEEENAPTTSRPCARPGLLPGRPPRPPGAAFHRRQSLGHGLPVRPSRPAVNHLREDDEGADGDTLPSTAELQKRREENIRALVNNSLQTCRQPLMSKFLSVLEGQVVLRKPFQSPVQGAPRMSDALRRKLAARRHFVPWGSSTPLPIPTMAVKPPTPPAVPVPEPLPEPPEPVPPAAEPELPVGIEPLVLWQAPPGEAANAASADGSDDCGDSVVVDNMLVRFLRPHQREGVQFMFDCVTGQRLEGKQGCILADDMGLGKTLQGITLMWTLLTCGHPMLGGCPVARRAIIVCPTSLVSNWDNECTKWLQGRLKTLAMCESSREDVVANIGMFLHPSNVYKVLIISYETFRMHAERFQVPHSCDLLLCDEAHRLKNDATLTNRALDNLPCKRRVLLSGTPMQNHLDEFFAMVDFCNPGVLGAPAQFRKYYELPILAGREPDASPDQAVLGEERSRELSGLTNNFILRRTNKLLSQHLPPKVIEVVCCRLTELQRQLYCHFLQSKAARRVLNGRTSSGVLSAITSLKKLCNHPKLIYDAVHSKVAAVGGGGGWDEGEGGGGGRAEGFEDVGSLFPPGLFDNGRVGRGGMAAGWEAVSGKMALLARMLHVLYTETNDRIVLVSNYTSTLDLFAHLCRERAYPFVRLDGTTTINKRQKLVKIFNDPAERQFAFLLSSKAGGCGLNLIGANRLVLFDPDWNPANDQQAAARVWRDGQRKRVFVYRFLSTGSIEEKVYQRQLSKEGLKQLVSKNGKAAANVMTAEDLRELFTLNAATWSDTYDYMCGGPGLVPEVQPPPPAGPAGGKDPINLAADDDAELDKDTKGPGRGEGVPGGPGAGEAERLPPVHKRQSGEPAEEDLANWGHHPSPETVPDAVMRRVAAPDVSFIFSCSVAGKSIDGGDEEERRLSEAAAVGATANATANAPTSAPAVARAAAVGIGARGCSSSNGRSVGGSVRANTPTAGSRLGLPVAPLVPPRKLSQKGGGRGGSVTPCCRTPAAATPAPAASGPALAAVAATASAAATATPLVRTPSASSNPVACHVGSGSASVLPTAGRPVATTSAAVAAVAAAAAAAATVGCQLPTSVPTRPTAAATATSPPSSGALRPSVAAPDSGSRPKPQPTPGTVTMPTGHKAAVAAAGSNSGGSRSSSSVTGALMSSGAAVPVVGSGTSGRAAATPPIGTEAAKPTAQATAAATTAAAAAAVTGQLGIRPRSCPPTEPLRSSIGPNMQPAKSRAATAAAAGAVVGRVSGLVVAGADAAAPLAVGAQAAGPVKEGVRGRAEMEGSGEPPLEAPKPKRQRAPGWYIDSDDDDFL